MLHTPQSLPVSFQVTLLEPATILGFLQVYYRLYYADTIHTWLFTTFPYQPFYVPIASSSRHILSSGDCGHHHGELRLCIRVPSRFWRLSIGSRVPDRQLRCPSTRRLARVPLATILKETKETYRTSKNYSAFSSNFTLAHNAQLAAMRNIVKLYVFMAKMEGLVSICVLRILGNRIIEYV